jgi:hypothetical protein
MATATSARVTLFEDIFSITALNPEGKKFECVNRLAATIHTLKLRGQARLSWREVRGQRLRVRVKLKNGVSRERGILDIGEFLGTAYN